MGNEVYRPNQIDQAALGYLRQNWRSQSDDVPFMFPQKELEFRLTQNIDRGTAIAQVRTLAGLCETHQKKFKLSAQNLDDYGLFWELAETELFDIIATPDFKRNPLTQIATSITKAGKNADKVIIGIDVYRKETDHQALATDYHGIPKETQHFSRLTRGNAFDLRQFRIIHQESPLYLGGISIHPDLDPKIAIPVIAKLGANEYVSTSEFARQPREGGRAIPQPQYLLVGNRHKRYEFDSTDDTIFLSDAFPATSGLTNLEIDAACNLDSRLFSRIRRCKEVWRLNDYERILVDKSRSQILANSWLMATLRTYGFL
ncbi:hypothetical protein HY989_02380 [Candidatus Micrarchaeota archaeon]|nr:hypothetical protein [Candidatus Micrarchaeota archaeon]